MELNFEPYLVIGRVLNYTRDPRVLLKASMTSTVKHFKSTQWQLGAACLSDCLCLIWQAGNSAQFSENKKKYTLEIQLHFRNIFLQHSWPKEEMPNDSWKEFVWCDVQKIWQIWQSFCLSIHFLLGFNIWRRKDLNGNLDKLSQNFPRFKPEVLNKLENKNVEKLTN